MAKFEVFKDKAGEFRFRYKASNGEIMFSSEGYKARASALDAIESIKKNAPGATVDDQTRGEAAKPA
ncbi:YegP family protein [Xanthobacter sp. V0B-10]|uniref:YegP family protein n=1 Tax=Xanthobacter albus TaxID=3119929 RepID=UPI00372A966B